MSRGLLDPKVDFVFKNIFGSPNHPEILISFLNATLKPKKKIVSVDIKKTDIEKQYIEDKYSRLDVKATTSNDEIINIEIQLKNENNMIKRSLYYLSKMYEEQLNEKEDYSMSNDSTQRELYDMRANSLRDKISELNAAEKKGIEKGKEEGRKEEKIKIARNMKLSGLDSDTIANITNLSPDEIDKL